jgi:glucosamine-6-phosphate deaminase
VKVILATDYTQMSRFAARFLTRRMHEAARPVLGLATGDTVRGTYDELIRLHRDEGCDFSQVTTFNLDEYVGLDPAHEQSYRSTMERCLFDHVNLDRGRTHLLNGCAPDLLAEATRYEGAISGAGGVTVQLLGLGGNGHIAFNEPGSSLASRTRVKRLSAETIAANSRFFASPEAVPRYVVTMGIATIMEARFLLLLASGARKAAAVAAMVEGPVSAACPGSVLQFHPHAFVVVDAQAATELAGRYESVDEVLADPHEEFLFEG